MCGFMTRGRLTVPLVEQRVATEGLALSAGMLAVAEEKAAVYRQSIPWHHIDMTDFDLGRRYSTIFLPVNSMVHLLHWRDLPNCLACVQRHLSEDGHSLIGYFNLALGVLLRDSGGSYPVG
jgi:hypothetical protein